MKRTQGLIQRPVNSAEALQGGSLGVRVMYVMNYNSKNANKECYCIYSKDKV